MTSVMVFVKHNGILVACQPHRAPDGCFWRCAHCDEILMRASFGVMNGMIRCTCGSDVELVVDGKIVEIGELNVLTDVHEHAIDSLGYVEDHAIDSLGYAATPRQPKQSAQQPRGEMNDEDFLRKCGISAGATEEEPC